ncbi:xanthine dehydrogenase [Pseudomonas savastanoi pv. retacarpa]|uniref:Xanthine and CO dehydrogenase maturation factor n=1 Tax=Pseudomonas savastanoi pv. nerii TaxID=360921 RepID=A0A267JQR0_PSESS|nr:MULTISPECIES: XdhC family protein [Pseudomonas]KAA3545430.1 XdhC family protein [Pseudomonas savastanoi]KPB17161.1 Xanthine and CO dehydrogenase maturation factor [Pseudomonas savastanoi]KPY43283.1 Xanthine and CO dehydrogenase maturation factor, XdhC/CoxF family [Pseudomonas savastanoi pv. retacarpa]KPY68011.1 Xanthine and CO dehydrogenase maturation factor, XdhC/CoxF family [Pseudomonas savastanoi pv. savastanoi]KUG40700.1 Xanthine and CO dehydrogenase maturation factor, XdhC/CoxF family 
MQQLDLQVIQQARTWVEQGRPVWLCTVLATFGSAPRAPGAMLACLESGGHCGSLSGGCVEDDFLERVGNRFFAPVSQVVRYGDGGLVPNVALPCGGVLDVLVEYLAPGKETAAHLESIENAFAGSALITRQVLLGSQQRCIGAGSMHAPRVQVDEERVTIRVGAVQRLLLAGLSPVAEFCASFALAMGYEVILCDPRKEVITGFSLPGVQVLEILPAVYIANGGCHVATAVVALTHDPRLDDLTLLEAVRTQAFYIGAMGSARTSSKRFERLSRIGGLDDASLERIHAPIGLRLGSKTPAEIAMAVMADILRVSNGIQRHAL